MAPKSSKKASVLLPDTKLNSTPKEMPSKNQKSTEFISESDDSGAEKITIKAKKDKKGKKKEKETVTIAVHRPKTNGVAKKAEVPASSKAAASKKAAKEQVAEESSSEESSDESTEQPKAAASDSSSEEEEEEEEISKPASSSDNSDESSESDDEDDDVQSTEQAAQQQSHTVSFQPAEPYVPPRGFAAVSTPLTTSSQAAKLFENLEGKEIWHITAPAGVSLSQLKELAMDKALAGAAVLNYKDQDYGFSTVENNEKVPCEVLVPQKNGYKALPTRITRTLHLQQVLNIPKLPSEKPDQHMGAEAFESITKSSVREHRPQVKGLRMRYFHSGFGDQDPGVLGDSESEDDAAAPTPALNKAEKRRRSDAGAEVPTKKHKKHRTAEELKKREEKKAKRKEKA